MKLQAKLPSQMSDKNAGAWLVPTLIPENSLVTLSAEPKRGKTLLAIECAVAVSLGEPVLHKYQPSRKGKVLLILLEDLESESRKRLTAVLLAHHCYDLSMVNNLHVVTGTELRLDQPEGRDALEETIVDIQPDLIVLDNYSRAVGSESLQVTKQVFGFLKGLKDRYRCSVLILAHEGKSKRSGGYAMRGSSDSFSWVEAHLRIVHDANRDQAMISRVFRNHPWHPDTPLHVFQSGSILRIEERYSWHDLQEQTEKTQNSEAKDAQNAVRLPN